MALKKPEAPVVADDLSFYGITNVDPADQTLEMIHSINADGRPATYTDLKAKTGMKTGALAPRLAALVERKHVQRVLHGKYVVTAAGRKHLGV